MQVTFYFVQNEEPNFCVLINKGSHFAENEQQTSVRQYMKIIILSKMNS